MYAEGKIAGPTQSNDIIPKIPLRTDGEISKAFGFRLHGGGALLAKQMVRLLPDGEREEKKAQEERHRHSGTFFFFFFLPTLLCWHDLPYLRGCRS